MNEQEKAFKKLLEEINGSVSGVSDRMKSLDDKLTGVDGKIVAIDSRMAIVESGLKSRAVSLPGVDEQKEKFSFQRAILAIATKDWRNAGFEKEVFEETHKKALSQGTDSAGGYIVPSQYVTEIIELLRSKTVVRELGATLMEGLTGSPVDLSKQTGGATMYWVAENSKGTTSQQTFGQLQLTPKQAMLITQMSNRLLRLSIPSAEALVRNDLAKALARGIDLAALRGTGTNNQPTGIANTVNINTLALGTHGATPSIDNIYDMLYKIELANADDGKLGFAFHPRTWHTLRKLKDNDNRHYLQPDPTQAQKGTLIGYPFMKSTQIPINLAKGSSGNVCSELYFGNWEELIIGMWGGMELFASQEAGEAFERAQTWVRVIQEIDIKLRHPESFVLISDALQ